MVRFTSQVLFAIFWIPACIVAIPLFLLFRWLAIRYFVWGSTQHAWKKCAKHWLAYGEVAMYAAHEGPPFSHSMAVAMGRTHRRAYNFFLDQLGNSNPLLAAYAFKCLIRARPSLQLKDIPDEILDRTELIPTIWADIGGARPLGEFIRAYFPADRELIAAQIR